MGELLKQFDARPQNAKKQTDATDSLVSQRQAAQRAGISERQQVTAVRVANVPREEFEQLVESEQPPTVGKLAELGMKPAPQPVVDLKGRDPGEFSRSLHYLVHFEYCVRDLKKMDHSRTLPILTEDELHEPKIAPSSGRSSISATADRPSAS